ncbi:hypothetical protein [Paenibacillus kandeliae]|uniref:hypothetical protein n=1 Tax=Paenibacillus kandeliae TaxID=3231269 RepID=UPI003457FE57
MMRTFIVSIFTVAALALFFACYKFPKEIHVTRSAVQCTENESASAKQTTVNIDGRLYRSLFGKPTFKGTVVIDSMPFSKMTIRLKWSCLARITTSTKGI